ncbi:MAG: TspO/MBR family protein [archaeon]|nr:TspO/MBR family protein [archaeon]
MKKRMNWKALIISFIIVYLVAFIGSIFTSPAVNSDWYQTIKPSITPPNYVFPIAWNILFFLIALSLYFAWTNSKNKNTKKRVAFLFGLNLALNILWSFLYFYLKNPTSAFFELIALWFSIVLMINLIYKISKKASWLLVPYLLWVSFAGILNYLSAF